MNIERVGVIGMGAMGRGIAEVTARSGCQVVLIKATPGSDEIARRTLLSSFDRAVQKGQLTSEERSAALARIRFSGDLDVLSNVDLVIESILEDLDRKRTLFSDLERRVGPQTILASNTSSLPLSSIGQGMKRLERFLGLHFFSPVPAMKLVELGTTEKSTPDFVEAAQHFVERLGKTAVVVADTPGYIVNRLLVPYLLDGIAALEAKIASAMSIDQAMKLGCGHPMGPLALSDAIGLDVVFAMAKTLHKELNDRRYSPPPLLRRLVLNGQLGKKSGIGIYDYSSDPPVENPALWPTVPHRLGA
jgi:3-hydroxybutyryl-CoA dehydrogenase